MAKIDPKKSAAAKRSAAAPKEDPPPVTNEVATRPAPHATSEVATKADLDNLLAMDAGSGMENMKSEDYAIPRLSILQALSPQINKRDDAYVEGAEAGMIYDSVANELYDGQEGILIIVVSYRRAHLQWWPRDSKKGKGFVKDWGSDPSILAQTNRSEKGQNLLADGSEIVPTGEYFCMLVDENDGTFERVLIPMAKTQLIKSKKLNTIASSLMVPVGGQLRQAPLFYRSYRFCSKPESNDKGNWFGWDITPGPALLPNTLKIPVLPFGERLYLEARSFKQAVHENKVKVAKPMEDSSTSTTGGPGTGDDTPM